MLDGAQLLALHLNASIADITWSVTAMRTLGGYAAR